MLTRLRLVPDEVASVLLVGHNPTLEDLLELLVDAGGSLPDRFPTAAVAEVGLAIARWSDLAPHVGRLGSFVTPRALEGTGD